MLKNYIGVRLSDEDKRVLDELTKELGESKSAVIKRVLNFFHVKRNEFMENK